MPSNAKETFYVYDRINGVDELYVKFAAYNDATACASIRSKRPEVEISYVTNNKAKVLFKMESR